MTIMNTIIIITIINLVIIIIILRESPSHLNRGGSPLQYKIYGRVLKIVSFNIFSFSSAWISVTSWRSLLLVEILKVI